MLKSCEDCGGPIQDTDAEVMAQTHGLLICEPCIASMDEELAVYEQVMRDEGYECVFDQERGKFVTRPVTP